MSDHSPEPWHVIDTCARRFINDADGKGVASASMRVEAVNGLELAEANAERIVACVNACAGIPTSYIAGKQVQCVIENGQCLLHVKADDLRPFAIEVHKCSGYTVTPPSKLDLSDKISRSMPDSKGGA